MVETRDRSDEHKNQTTPYDDANGFERYAFDDFPPIGTGFSDARPVDKVTPAASNSLRICLIDVSSYRAARITDYLRSYGHEVTEYQTADDACDALFSQQYDLMLIGSVGSARAPLIRCVKDSVSGTDNRVRIAVISTNDSISRELIAAGADDIVDGNTESPQLNAILVAPFRYGKQAHRVATRPAAPQPTIDEPQAIPSSPRVTTNVANATRSTPRSTPNKTPKTIVRKQRQAQADDTHDEIPLLRSAVKNKAATHELDFESLRRQVQEHIAAPEQLHFPAPAKDEPPHFAESEHDKPADDDDPTKAHHDPLFETFKKLKTISDGVQTRGERSNSGALPGDVTPHSPTLPQLSGGKLPSVLAMGSALAAIVLSNLHHL